MSSQKRLFTVEPDKMEVGKHYPMKCGSETLIAVKRADGTVDIYEPT